MSGLSPYLEGLERHPPAAEADLDALIARHPWAPPEYVQCLRWSNGLEGYVGGRGYLRLWPARAAGEFNLAYHVAEFLPTAFLFGTDAAAMGYLFDRRTPGQVHSVEMAALDEEYITQVAGSFEAFVHHLAHDGPAMEGLTNCGPPEWLRGNVIHEKHPIVLGGPAHDPENRVLVPAEKHPELAVLFARILRSVRTQTVERR